MSDEDKKFEKNLVSDQEFNEIMDAGFRAEGEPIDVLSKKRQWQNISSEIKDIEPDRVNVQQQGDGDRFWQVGLALAACVILSIAISLFRPMFSPDQTIKGPGDTSSVELFAYVVGEDGAMEHFDPQSDNPPLTLLPMILADREVYAALLKFGADQRPEVLVGGQKVEAGQERGFSVSSEDLFAIEWSGEAREIYCVVALDSIQELQDALAEIGRDENYALDGNCLILPKVR